MRHLLPRGLDGFCATKILLLWVRSRKRVFHILSGCFYRRENMFFIQNEGIRKPDSTEEAHGHFMSQIYPHRVIHIVKKSLCKNLLLKINCLRKLSTFGGKQSLTKERNALLSLPLSSRFFTPPFHSTVPSLMSRFLARHKSRLENCLALKDWLCSCSC